MSGIGYTPEWALSAASDAEVQDINLVRGRKPGSFELGMRFKGTTTLWSDPFQARSWTAAWEKARPIAAKMARDRAEGLRLQASRLMRAGLEIDTWASEQERGSP